MEGLLLRALDRLDRVARGDLPVAVELLQLRGSQPVQIGHRAQHPLVPQAPDELLADPLDVHRRLDPVDEGLQAARGAGAVRTAVHRLPLRFDDLRSAQGAALGHLPPLRAGLVPARRADHLRNDVARALDDDDVALADVLAVDVLLVVKRRARDGDAPDLDRLEHGPRIERPRAADTDRDLEKLRLRGHRRPLEGTRPARAAM